MKREYQITVKLNDEELYVLEQNAEAQGLNKSAFIREVACYADTNWISKQTVSRCLGKMSAIISNYQTKEKKLTKLLQKEIVSLWEKV